MTPTEQDEELREKIAGVFDELCEPTNGFWHRDSGLHWAGKIMQLIAADRKRVALEARLDELAYIRQKGQRIVVPGMEDRPVWSDAFRERIAELKAQQEER